MTLICVTCNYVIESQPCENHCINILWVWKKFFSRCCPSVFSWHFFPFFSTHPLSLSLSFLPHSFLLCFSVLITYCWESRRWQIFLSRKGASRNGEEGKKERRNEKCGKKMKKNFNFSQNDKKSRIEWKLCNFHRRVQTDGVSVSGGVGGFLCVCVCVCLWMFGCLHHF